MVPRTKHFACADGRAVFVRAGCGGRVQVAACWVSVCPPRTRLPNRLENLCAAARNSGLSLDPCVLTARLYAFSKRSSASTDPVIHASLVLVSWFPVNAI